MLLEREASDKLFQGCEDQRSNLPEVWREPHQKEWHNRSGKTTVSLQNVWQTVPVLLGLQLSRL
jgi:hypothetical protein